MTHKECVMTQEESRLQEARKGTSNWRKWGPYVSERQWGTVREDYSEGVTPGISSPTIKPARAPTAGARTAHFR